MTDSIAAQTLKNLFNRQETAELTPHQEESLRKQLREDINYLSSFQLEGRKAGEVGAENAANYIKNRLSQLGIESPKLSNKFQITAGGRYGGRTRLVINQAFVRIPEEAIALSYPEHLQFSDHFIKDHKEALTTWVIPLFEDVSEGKRSLTQINNRLQDLVAQAIAYDATALFIYDEYEDLSSFKDLPAFLDINFPIVLINHSAYKKHLNKHQKFASISFQLEWVHDTKSAENIFGFINHNADKTIIISASYDFKGFYYDHSLPYGNNKMIYYGADKNASGVAAVLGLAEVLQLKKELNNDYNYLFAFFSGSQNGHQGVAHFLEQIPPIIQRQIYVALHFDHVGRYQLDQGLNVAGNAPNEIIDLLSELSTRKWMLNLGGKIPQYSDAGVYSQFNISTLAINTGAQDDHDKVADHPSKVNISSVNNVVKMFYQLLYAKEFPELISVQPKGKLKNANVKTVPIRWEDWGIEFDIRYDGLGMKVITLNEKGLGKKSKLEPGDIIFNVNQTPVVNGDEVRTALEQVKYGSTITIKVKRDVSVLDLETEL